MIKTMMQTFMLAAVSLSLTAQSSTVLPLTSAQLQHMQVQWGPLQWQTGSMSAGDSVSYPAEVQLPPRQTRVVTAAQSGLITQLLVSVGDSVKAGQVIGQLSSPDLVSLQSSYLQAETQARLHAQALQRDEALFRDGIIAQRRMQETQSAFETSQALLSEHKQTLRLAGMSEAQVQQLAHQRRMQSGMAIVAPIGGQVMAQHQQVGARVDMATPILTISNPKPLWLMIQVPLEQARQLQPGMPVSLPKLGLQARIDTVLRQVNKSSQSSQVRASITQGSEQLSVGQIVDVALMQASASDGIAYVVPRSAVARRGEQAVIFVRASLGVAVVPIQIVREQDQQLTIRSVEREALRADATVAMQGVAALKGHWLGLGASAGKE